MTTKELADILTPQVRDAVDRSKASILGDMQPFKRFWVRTLWPLVLSVGVPAVTRINVEFIVSKYKQVAKPYVGVYLDAWIKLNENSDNAVLKQIADYLSVVETDESQFLNVVQQILRGDDMSEISNSVDLIKDKYAGLKEIARGLDKRVNDELMTREDAKIVLGYHLDDLFEAETSFFTENGFQQVSAHAYKVGMVAGPGQTYEWPVSDLSSVPIIDFEPSFTYYAGL